MDVTDIIDSKSQYQRRYITNNQKNNYNLVRPQILTSRTNLSSFSTLRTRPYFDPLQISAPIIDDRPVLKVSNNYSKRLNEESKIKNSSVQILDASLYNRSGNHNPKQILIARDTSSSQFERKNNFDKISVDYASSNRLVDDKKANFSETYSKDFGLQPINIKESLKHSPTETKFENKGLIAQNQQYRYNHNYEVKKNLNDTLMKTKIEQKEITPKIVPNRCEHCREVHKKISQEPITLKPKQVAINSCPSTLDNRGLSTIAPKPRLGKMTQAVHKVIMAGCGGVGKSAITLQYMYSEFVADYEPTKADSYRKTCDINGVESIIDILDTAGQEQYQGIRDFYYRAGEGFLLIFAIDDMSSFQEITEYINLIRMVKNNTIPPMILVGNKSDLADRRKVPVEQAQELANNYNIPYIETSARNQINVNKIFEDLCTMLAQSKQPARTENTSKPKKPKHPRKIFRCNIL